MFFQGNFFPELDKTTVTSSEPVSLCCPLYDFMTYDKDSYSHSYQNETNKDIFTPLYLYSHSSQAFCEIPSLTSSL